MKFDKLLIAFLFLSFACLSFAGSIVSISPESAVPGEEVTLTLNCTDTTFTSDTVLAVAIIKEPIVISAESFTVLNNTQLEANFALPASMTKGVWGVAIELEGTDMSLEKSFSVFNPDINGDGVVDLRDFGFYANDFLDPMPGYILVPDIYALTPEQANAAITAAGLRVGYTLKMFSDVVYGNVADQTPLAGTAVKASDNIAVNYYISGIPILTEVTVPQLSSNIAGEVVTREEAEAILRSEGFSIGEIIYEDSPTVPNGHAITYDPPSGSKVTYIYSKSEIYIDIVVSSESQWGVVPGLYGLTRAEAQQVISDTGFNIGSVITELSSTVPFGCVVSQNPPAGQEHSQPQNVSINFAISGVPIISFLTVPDLAGLTPAQANSAITSAGLSVGNTVDTTESVRRRPDQTGELVCNPYYVHWQNPIAGTYIANDDSNLVDYSYSKECYWVDND